MIGATRLITIGAGITAAVFVSRQCRRPTGPFGRRVARVMNLSHGSLTTWGLSHLVVDPRSRILDIGCGGGRTIATLASMAPQGTVSGIDYSSASIATARVTNADRIAAAQVDLQLASVSALPFPPDSFDVVTAIETHYYWPDLPNDVREVYRVLRPGGQFMLLAEVYRGGRGDFVNRFAMFLLRGKYLTADQHRELFAGADFADIQVDEMRTRGWICVTGRKRDHSDSEPGSSAPP